MTNETKERNGDARICQDFSLNGTTGKDDRWMNCPHGDDGSERVEGIERLEAGSRREAGVLEAGRGFFGMGFERTEWKKR